MSHLQEYNKIPFKEIKTEVIEQLKLNYAHDNIDADEFEKRLTAAESADDKGALTVLVNDLPFVEPDKKEEDPVASSKKAMVSQSNSSIAINHGKVRESQMFVSIFSGVERKGLWRPARRINSIAVMGGFDLNFTKAEIPPEGVDINVFCLMGGGDIIVPEGVNVEISSVPIMGGVDNSVNDHHDPNAPTIRIRALAIMGGLDVRHPKKKRKKLT